MKGAPTRAARDSGTPLISPQVFRRWVETERDKRIAEGHPPSVLNSIAASVRCAGVSISTMPVCEGGAGWLTTEQLHDLAANNSEFILAHDNFLNRYKMTGQKLILGSNVILESFRMGLMISSSKKVRKPLNTWNERWPKLEKIENASDIDSIFARSLTGLIWEVIAQAWNCPVKLLLDLKRNRFTIVKGREIGTLLGAPVFEPFARVLKRPDDIPPASGRQIRPS
jgi:hypothetical protein